MALGFLSAAPPQQAVGITPPAVFGELTVWHGRETFDANTVLPQISGLVLS
jgi:hypothetical protein